jgi:GDPmannose 4,6-dehydratase
MNKSAFITGINGQDGSYLAEFLLEQGYNVYGIIRRMSLMNTARIDHLYSNKNFNIFYGDVTDSTSIRHVLENIKDEYVEVYHLAAQSHVKVSFEIPEYTTEVNAVGTLKLLDVCKSIKKNIKVYIACTSEMYGKVIETPQNEKTPFNPVSPYAISKQFAFYTSVNYRESYNMFICCGILFNHESPRRGINFVTRKITLGIGKILRGEIDYIELGNLDSVRDWGHAKDYVEAMYLMLQQDSPDDYVIATNETHSVREFVEKAFLVKDFVIRWEGDVGFDQYGIVRIKTHEKYMRPVDVEYLRGDSSKARIILKWTPKITFDNLVEEMVENDTSL